MKEGFKILAEHFAEKAGVKIIYTDGPPKANPYDQTIYIPKHIPEPLFGVVLAGLLKECHKFSSDKRIFGDVSPTTTPQELIENLLTEMMTDKKVFKKYPNAPELYKELLEFTEEKISSEQLPKEIKILKNILLKSYDGDFSKFFSYDGEVSDFEKEHEALIKEIQLHTSQNRFNKKQLIDQADRLSKALFKESFEKQNKNQQDQQELFSQTLQKTKQIESDYMKSDREQKKLSKELWETKAMSEEAKKDREQKQSDVEKNQTKKFDLQKELQSLKRDANRKLQELQGQLQKEREKTGEKIAKGKSLFSGFSSLDSGDFVKQTAAPINLEQELLEFLINKQERKVFSDEGKLVPNKLATYFNPVDLFEATAINQEEKTKIFFIVDASGSMEGSRATNTLGMLTAICGVLDKGINYHGMNLEYAVYTFAEKSKLVKDFEKPWPGGSPQNAIRFGGETLPKRTIMEVENVVDDRQNTKEYIFFITDGNFGDDDYHIINNYLGGKKRWVFIGMEIADSNPLSHKFFGKYNIEVASDTKEVVIRALESVL